MIHRHTAVGRYPCHDYMKNGYVYIGVTSNLVKRIWEHKEKMVDGFTKRYNLTRLVYYEIHDRIDDAINREKQMKEWNRNWKLRQIIDFNPE